MKNLGAVHGKILSVCIAFIGMGVFILLISFLEASSHGDKMRNNIFEARVSVNASQLRDRLDVALVEMKEVGATEGVLFFPLFSERSRNMGFAYITLLDLREEAARISLLDVSSIEYRVAFVDVKTTLSLMEPTVGLYRLLHSPYALVGNLYIIISIGMMIVVDVAYEYLLRRRSRRSSY